MHIEKKETIAATMRAFMESSPSVTEFPTYKSLNDAVGKVHGLAEGKCQSLAGEKAWAWTADPVTKTWRKATDTEIAACREKAASKVHGTRKSKAMSDEDRAALNAQITALEAVNNPALAGLLADLRGKVIADDLARKGSLKDRLQAAVDKLTLARAVFILEWQIAAIKNAAAAGLPTGVSVAAAENAAAEAAPVEAAEAAPVEE